MLDLESGSRWKPAEELVEIVVAGRGPGDRVTPLVVLLELVHRLVEQFVDDAGVDERLKGFIGGREQGDVLVVDGGWTAW